MICMYCRKPIGEDAQFCPECQMPVLDFQLEDDQSLSPELEDDLLLPEAVERRAADASGKTGRRKLALAAVVVLLVAGGIGFAAGQLLPGKQPDAGDFPQMERLETTLFPTESLTEPTLPTVPETVPETTPETSPKPTTEPTTEPTQPEYIEEIIAKSAAKRTMLPLSTTAYFTASSELVDGTRLHKAKNAFDGSRTTAWVEGAKNYGIGESIQVIFREKTTLNGVVIRNGYQKSQKLFNANARVKTLGVNISDRVEKVLCLEDNMNPQEFVFSAPVEADAITFTILEVYPGTKYKDTCISEINLFHDPTATRKRMQIPEGAGTFGGHLYYCYKVSMGTTWPNDPGNWDSLAQWDAMQAYCKSLGGHLAIIDSPEENDFLYQFSKLDENRNDTVMAAYFGLARLEDGGSWEWYNGERPRYTNWKEGAELSSGGRFAMFRHHDQQPSGVWYPGTLLPDVSVETTTGGETTTFTVCDVAYFICEWEPESVT